MQDDENRNDGEAAAQRTQPKGVREYDAEYDSEVTPFGNTVTSCPPLGYKQYRQGIDSMYVSFRGEMYDFAHSELQRLKNLAHSKDEKEKAQAQLKIGARVFEVFDRGHNGFPFVIRDNAFHIKLNDGKGKRPVAYVQISSYCLNTMPPQKAYEEAKDVIRYLVALNRKVVLDEKTKKEKEGDEFEGNLSRLDVYVDFSANYPFDALQSVQFLTRIKNVVRYSSSNRCTGFVIGAGSDLLFRLYNKTIEIAKSDKNYMEALWKERGWDGITPIWRGEFQLQGEQLKRYNATDPYNACFDIGRLWSALTRFRLRLVEIGGHQDRDRWPLSQLWHHIQMAFNDPPPLPWSKLYKSSRPPSFHFILSRMTSLICQYMAIEEIPDIMSAAQQMVTKAGFYHFQYRPEIEWSQFLDDKVANYRKKYNVGLNLEKE